MGYCLAPGISFAIHVDRAIVLDLRRDRYRQLSKQLTLALMAGQRAGEPAFDAAFTRLLADKIVVAVDGATDIAPVTLLLPTSSALEIDWLPRLPQMGRGAVLAALLATRLSLAMFSLNTTIEHARAIRKRSSLMAQPQLALRIAQAFARHRTATPIPRACVIDSLALSRLLCRAGVKHDLAFGVRFDPFTAHAWVQTEGHILSDNAAPVASNLPVFKL